MKQLPVFKVRCSAIGKIMSEPKGKSMATKIQELEAKIAEAKEKHDALKDGLKSKANAALRIEKMGKQLEEMLPFKDAPNLSGTCISFLEAWCNETIYERRAEFTSKQTDKGNLVEEDAIVYASGHIVDMGLCSKNETHFSDDFFQGTPDVLSGEYVFDMKSSWTHNTFPLYSPEIPETDYLWQVKGYMQLTGKRKGRVIFCLMSMPEEMLRKEARWKLPEGFSEQDYNEWAAKFQYDDLPPCLRLKEYEVVWNEEDIEAIKARVMECRKYIESVIVPALKINVEKYGDDEE